MKPAPKPLVYRHPRTKFWQARFPAWDAKAQKWKAHNVSTKVTDHAAAKLIAAQLAATARAAGPSGSISRDHVVDVINHILRLAGHQEVVDHQTWAGYSARWLELMKARVPSQLSQGTYSTYIGHLKTFTTHLGRDAARLPLSAITADHIQKWYHGLIEGGLKPTTANNMATTLRTIFDRAQNEGFTQRNPVALLTRAEHVGNQRDPFTQADQEALLKYLRASPDREDWLTVTLLGLCTSQRLRDCADAVRTAFEFTGPWLMWTLTQRKTGTTLRIPIVEPALSHIAQILQRPATGLFLAPAMANQKEGGWQDSLSAQFASILEAAGVTGRHIAGKGKGRSFNSKTFHSTRHTCNSALARAGVPADIRRKITGHADDETNLIYTHLDDETKAQALLKALSPPSQKKAVREKAS